MCWLGHAHSMETAAPPGCIGTLPSHVASDPMGNFTSCRQQVKDEEGAEAPSAVQVKSEAAAALDSPSGAAEGLGILSVIYLRKLAKVRCYLPSCCEWTRQF